MSLVAWDLARAPVGFSMFNLGMGKKKKCRLGRDQLDQLDQLDHWSTWSTWSTWSRPGRGFGRVGRVGRAGRDQVAT